MIQLACPAALLLLLLPFIVRALLPAVKGLHGDALRVPFLNDLQKSAKNPARPVLVPPSVTDTGRLSGFYF